MVGTSRDGLVPFTCGSNPLCQNIASIPLLWIAPLSIYLLSFILCFDGTRWYRREIFLPCLPPLAWASWPGRSPTRTSRTSCCCKSRVLRGAFRRVHVLSRRDLRGSSPHPRYLTRFYLMTRSAARSARAGRLVSPLFLPAYFELAFGLVLCAALLLFQSRRLHPVFFVLGARVVPLLARRRRLGNPRLLREHVSATRNFYGVFACRMERRHANYHRSLIHARSCTGRNTRLPSSSEADDVLHAIVPASAARSNRCILRLARCGSESSVLHEPSQRTAARGRLPFYDINPAVIGIANREFHFSFQERGDDRNRAGAMPG